MKPIDSFCDFIENKMDRIEGESNSKIEVQPKTTQAEKPYSELKHREGMSLESAKFFIGCCADKSHHEIQNIENKGRYFTAKIMDAKGKQVNELLVDKLNGMVRFLR